MARSFFSNVKVAPTHPPPSVENVSEPFIRPSTSTELPGSGFSAVKHHPTSKAITSRPTSATKFPGTGSSAVKHQPTSQTKTSQLTSAVNTGTEPSAKLLSTVKLESHQPHTDRPSATDRPLSSDPADTGCPALHRSRRDSISSLTSDAGSELSDRTP